MNDLPGPVYPDLADPYHGVLQGLVYPDLADPYHGERPCCFSHDGRHVATGSEDGFLQVWDLTGAQVSLTALTLIRALHLSSFLSN